MNILNDLFLPILYDRAVSVRFIFYFNFKKFVKLEPKNKNTWQVFLFFKLFVNSVFLAPLTILFKLDLFSDEFLVFA